MTLPDELLQLLRKPSLCFIATLMPDGSPQLTETWVGTDGEHIQVNVVQEMQKAHNVARDPRVAVNIVDADNPMLYWGVRGRVIDATTDGAAEHIDELSQKYMGQPYQHTPGWTRLLLTIAADSVHSPRG